jgi:hypothetical protein
MQLISWNTLSQGCLVSQVTYFTLFCTLSHPTYGNQTGPPECLPKDMPYAMATVFPVWFHAWAQCSHLVVVQCVRRGSYCVLGPVWRHQSAGERHLRKSSRSMIHSAPCVLSGRKLKQKAISFQDQSTLKGEKSIFDVDTSQKEHSHVLQYTAYFNP